MISIKLNKIVQVNWLGNGIDGSLYLISSNTVYPDNLSYFLRHTETDILYQIKHSLVYNRILYERA